MRGGTGSANGLRAAARRPRSGRLERFLAALDAALDAAADQLEAELERIRCAFVYPSRRRCSNTAAAGGYCRLHTTGGAR